MTRYFRAWLWLVPLLALLTGPVAAGLFDRFGDSSQERILDADQAFQLTVNVIDSVTVEARWIIAPDYYLYRDKFKLRLVDAGETRITTIDIPTGEPKEDPYFGQQYVFHREVVLTAHLQRESSANDARTLQIEADYQGCAEIGVCYPPLSQIVTVALPASNPGAALNSAATSNSVAESGTPADSSSARSFTPAEARTSETTPRTPAINEPEQDRLTRLLDEQRYLAIPAFFGFGLLLAFTPCVFPMVPILSSLIAGQGASLTRRRAILLALIYVLAMALTYTVAGVLAAALGQNIQAWFQNPWIIALFSGLFLFLALSMFGLYDMQLPSYLQHRLTELSNRQRGGQFTGVAVMGFLSALIVGPCVAPPLIGALTFITVTGDLMLGAVALFALSLGMGVPLLVIGASAGHWLPRAGHWMERIKRVFGVLLLAVALWLLERILPAAVIMVLWATLFIVTATYMGALQPVAHGAPAWRTLVKGLGMVLLIYGVLLLVGVAGGGRDPWQPLRGLGFVASTTSEAQAPLFHPVKTTDDVDAALRQAAGQPVLLDFYADWCVSCKELERTTFTDPTVRAMLGKMRTLRADVTANDAADQALMRRFGIIGPPAILFFGPDGQERREYRLVGFLDAEAFDTHLRSVLNENG